MGSLVRRVGEVGDLLLLEAEEDVEGVESRSLVRYGGRLMLQLMHSGALLLLLLVGVRVARGATRAVGRVSGDLVEGALCGRCAVKEGDLAAGDSITSLNDRSGVDDGAGAGTMGEEAFGGEMEWMP